MILAEYKTSDIILASCLRITGCPMVSIELVGNKGVFVFENVDEDLLEDYDLGKTFVEPVSFNNTIKQLTTSVRRMVAKQIGN